MNASRLSIQTLQMFAYLKPYRLPVKLLSFIYWRVLLSRILVVVQQLVLKG